MCKCYLVGEKLLKYNSGKRLIKKLLKKKVNRPDPGYPYRKQTTLHLWAGLSARNNT